MTIFEERDVLLAAEDKALADDRELYLDCLNNKILRDRQAENEVRQGLILYHNVYRFIREQRHTEKVKRKS